MHVRKYLFQVAYFWSGYSALAFPFVSLGNGKGGAGMPKFPDGVVWRRSSRSEAGACIEVARIPSLVAIRNSVFGNDLVLVLTEPQWAAFVSGIKAGEFDS